MYESFLCLPHDEPLPLPNLTRCVPACFLSGRHFWAPPAAGQILSEPDPGFRPFWTKICPESLCDVLLMLPCLARFIRGLECYLTMTNSGRFRLTAPFGRRPSSPDLIIFVTLRDSRPRFPLPMKKTKNWRGPRFVLERVGFCLPPSLFDLPIVWYGRLSLDLIIVVLSP